MRMDFHGIRAFIKILKRNKSIIKIAIAFALTGLLIAGDKVSLSSINKISSQPSFWLIVFFGNILVSTLTVTRWNFAIRRHTKRLVPFFRLFSYNWSSLYVGLAFLGTLGTDSWRIASLHNNERLTIRNATKSIVWDRGFSLCGLILLVTLFFVSQQLNWTDLRIPLIILCALTLLVPEVFLTIISFMIKASIVAYIYFLSIGSIENPIDLIQQIMFALAVEAIPISWQGIGTGHIAFEFFVGEEGANIFSSYLLGRVVFKMIGFFFFIRSNIKPESIKNKYQPIQEQPAENPEHESDPNA